MEEGEETSKTVGNGTKGRNWIAGTTTRALTQSELTELDLFCFLPHLQEKKKAALKCSSTGEQNSLHINNNSFIHMICRSISVLTISKV